MVIIVLLELKAMALAKPDAPPMVVPAHNSAVLLFVTIATLFVDRVGSLPNTLELPPKSANV